MFKIEFVISTRTIKEQKDKYKLKYYFLPKCSCIKIQKNAQHINYCDNRESRIMNFHCSINFSINKGNHNNQYLARVMLID